jgi:phosphohistidine phosphatase
MASIDLYLVRHGLAAERAASGDDRQRPLTRAGIRRTRAVAKQLRDAGIRFDHLLTSPLLRARQTADILHDVGLASRAEESRDLAPGGDFRRWLRWLSRKRDGGGQHLALVGHEPGLSEWAERLVWGEVRHQLALKKAGVIGLTLPATGSPVGRSVLFLLTPPRFLG